MTTKLIRNTNANSENADGTRSNSRLALESAPKRQAPATMAPECRARADVHDAYCARWPPTSCAVIAMWREQGGRRPTERRR
jgi:hypothetical protein